MNIPAGNADIAIIGLSCRFPRAATAEEFWTNLCNGAESITFFPIKSSVHLRRVHQPCAQRFTFSHGGGQGLHTRDHHQRVRKSGDSLR
jgi:Beta-ketoacyl synthase, N-terminal domain